MVSSFLGFEVIFMDANFVGILIVIILLIPKIWYEYWIRNLKRNRKKRRKNKKNFKNPKNKNKRHRKHRKSSNINELSWDWYSVQEFRRKTKKGYKQYDFDGVYVIHDLDYDMYYVGQSINVIKRLRGHFNGQASKGGADDLNEALINGHNMEIALLRLKNSSFRDLDDMEAYFIDYFDSYYHGYNRTRGNYIEFRTVGPIHKGGHHVKSFSLR